LLAGSPAINAGSNPLSLAFDQRGSGFPRVVGGTADMGAFELSTLPPTVDIVNVTPDPRNTAVTSVGINFNEAILGFNLADLSLTRNGGANLLTGAQTLTSGDNKTWMLGNLAGLTGSAGSYVLTLTAAGSGIQDLDGNLLATGASDSWTMNTASLVPGDANRDGMVNLIDFGIVKQNFGVGTIWDQGDFDGNAKVDLGDFSLLKQNFGKSGQVANAAAVDEFYARIGLAISQVDEADTA
jgi:hypothetical protein